MSTIAGTGYCLHCYVQLLLSVYSLQQLGSILLAALSQVSFQLYKSTLVIAGPCRTFNTQHWSLLSFRWLLIPDTSSLESTVIISVGILQWLKPSTQRQRQKQFFALSKSYLNRADGFIRVSAGTDLGHPLSVYHVKVKDKRNSSSSTHLTAMGHHLPYGMTQCYLPPDTSECARLPPARQAGTQLT